MESTLMAEISRSRKNADHSRQLCEWSRELIARSERLYIVPIRGASDAKDVAASSRRPDDERRTAATTPDRRRVLVVVRDPTMRAVLADAIRRHHDVTGTDDVAAAIKLAAAGGVDVVLAGCFLFSEPLAASACVSLARSLYEACPWVPLVLVADPPPTDVHANVLLTGVRAFVPRDFVAWNLATTLAHVARPRAAAVPDEAKVRAVRHAFSVLEASVTDMPALGELAAMVHMSRSHFSRTFHAVAGMTLRDYVRDLRLRHAEHLLRTSTRSLTYVASEAGFYDLPHLDKAFRQRLGISPRMFRARYAVAA
jgi:AraC-like DNA-binding protein